MAKEKAADKKQAAAPKKKGGKGGFLLTMIFLGFAAPFIFPTLILMGIGLLPTLVALFIDTDREHSTTAAIGAMNCAGLSPFLIDLWVKGQNMSNMFAILRDTSTWLVTLGAAFIGQLIVFAIPQTMVIITIARLELRVRTLKSNLEQLKTTWGPDVASNKALEKIR
ncbi:MAG: hypothetical protein JO253_03385 [Alphaproteobacteria bacterium]|nr:hypothetical protein [Alphaproteobacteria bacterium]